MFCQGKGDYCDGEKGHTTIGPKVVVARTSSITDYKCEDFKGAHNDWSNVVAVPN